MRTPRHNIDCNKMMDEIAANIDTLFELCDAEFNSSTDIHASFNQAYKDHKTVEEWVDDFLRVQVDKVMIGNKLYFDWEVRQLVAEEIARMWFADVD